GFEGAREGLPACLISSLPSSGDNYPPTSAISVSLVTRRAKVKKHLLEDAVGNDDWAVNNKYDHYREPFPVEEIIRRAESQIGKVVLYRLFYKNCEHFVTEVRYGEGVSEQVTIALRSFHNVSTAATVTGLVALNFVPCGPLVAAVGLGTGACVAFAANRVAHRRICAKFKMAGKYILEEMCC
uniref:LRAT domain-containing protein n=1 Tax=Ficedula albicollis TaxID=59894 RepID=A0A803VM93_FICAL